MNNQFIVPCQVEFNRGFAAAAAAIINASNLR